MARREVTPIGLPFRFRKFQDPLQPTGGAKGSERLEVLPMVREWLGHARMDEI